MQTGIFSSRKNIIFLVLYTCAVLAVATTAYLATDMYKIAHPKHKLAGNDKLFMSDVAYYDLPRMNLTIAPSDGDKTRRLSMEISLEVEKKDIGRMHDYQPRISDRLVRFTREQNVRDLGEAYNQRLFREALLEETQKSNLPIPVLDIVIKRLLVF